MLHSRSICIGNTTIVGKKKAPPPAHKGHTISFLQMSCLAFTVVHLTSIAHRLTLQSSGHRPPFEVSCFHHVHLHHVSSIVVTRDLLCWFVLWELVVNRFLLVNESLW